MSADSLNSKWNEDAERSNENKVEKATYRVEQTAPTETYRSFHIAHIVPDLFKNHEDSFNKTTVVEEEKVSTKNGSEARDIHHEPIMESLQGRMNIQNIKLDSESNHSLSQGINTTIKLEESLEKTAVKTPIGAPVFGFQDRETVALESLEFSHEEKPFSEMDENYKLSDDRMPLLSPDKPLAVSLIELDHSYGLVLPEEPTVVSVEEAELFDDSIKDPPLPNDRELTESPVVDIVTVDSVLSMLPVPELTPPRPQFPVRPFEVDDELVYEFHRLGIDAEDCYYLKVGFEQLQLVGSDSVVDAHWSSHPHIFLNMLIFIVIFRS